MKTFVRNIQKLYNNHDRCSIHHKIWDFMIFSVEKSLNTPQERKLSPLWSDQVCLTESILNLYGAHIQTKIHRRVQTQKRNLKKVGVKNIIIFVIDFISRLDIWTGCLIKNKD